MTDLLAYPFSFLCRAMWDLVDGAYGQPSIEVLRFAGSVINSVCVVVTGG